MRYVDSRDCFALKRGVHPSARATIETQLTELYQREQALDGEMNGLAHEIDVLMQEGKPVSAQRMARLERLKETHSVVKQRLEELRARMPDWKPPWVSEPGDF